MISEIRFLISFCALYVDAHSFLPIYYLSQYTQLIYIYL